jgi:hypothetical protein
MFEWRGATFPEILGHFGSEEECGQKTKKRWSEGTRIFSGNGEFFRNLGKGALENFLALRVIFQ